MADLIFKAKQTLLLPIKSLRRRYVPLLLIYFAYGLQGFSTIALSFWQKEALEISAEKLIGISVWMMLPWTLKIIFGQLIDHVPIGRNRRQSYIWLGAGLMTVGTILLASLAGGYEWIQSLGSPYQIYLLSSVLTAFGFVIQDVTADAMTTEVVERHTEKNGKIFPRKAGDIEHDLAMIQILGRLALSLAGILVAGIGGIVTELWSYETIFWIMLALPVISCLGVRWVRLDPESSKSPTGKLDPWLIGGGILFTIISIGFAASDLVYGQETVFLISLIVLGSMFMKLLQSVSAEAKKIIIGTFLALFLYRLAPMNIGPGLQWWLIDELGFSPSFFGVLGQIGSITAFTLLWFFSDQIANKSLRSVFLILIGLNALMGIPELLLFHGIHASLGFSAENLALFDTALGDPLIHVSMVPILSLIAFYAPAGHQGTWFAVGASLMNLAISGGNIITKYLNQWFPVNREVADELGNILIQADYGHIGNLLTWKIILGIIIPLAGILLFLRKPKNVMA